MKTILSLISLGAIFLISCQPVNEPEPVQYGVVSYSPQQVCAGSPSMRAQVIPKDNPGQLQILVNGNPIDSRLIDSTYSFFFPKTAPIVYPPYSMNITFRDEAGETKGAFSVQVNPPFIKNEQIQTRKIISVPSIIPWGDTLFYHGRVKMTVNDKDAPEFHILFEDRENIIHYGVFRPEDPEFKPNPTRAKGVNSLWGRIDNLDFAVMDNGLVSMIWQASDSDTVLFSQSTDQGLSWSEPTMIKEDYPQGFCQLFIAGQSSLLLSTRDMRYDFEAPDQMTAYLSISEDKGQNWNRVTIDPYCHSGGIEIVELPDGTLLTALFDSKDKLFKIKKSTDGGYQWQDTHTFPKLDTDHYAQFPEIWLKKGPDNKMIVQYSPGGYGLEALVYFSVSADNGGSWSMPKSLHDHLYLSHFGAFSFNMTTKSLYAVGTNCANIIVNRANQSGDNWTAPQFITSHDETRSARGFTLTQTAYRQSFIHQSNLYIFWLDRSDLNFCRIKLVE